MVNEFVKNIGVGFRGSLVALGSFFVMLLLNNLLLIQTDLTPRFGLVIFAGGMLTAFAINGWFLRRFKSFIFRVG